MYNTPLTLGWLRERTKDMPDHLVISVCDKNGEIRPYTDWDANGDALLFQVYKDTGSNPLPDMLVLGYGD